MSEKVPASNSPRDGSVIGDPDGDLPAVETVDISEIEKIERVYR